MQMPARTFEIRSHLLQLLFLIAVTGLMYLQCLSHEFQVTWDDYYYVVDNPAIRGFSWANLRTMFSRYYLGNYAPLQILSYAVDYVVWGLWPGGFILTNILLHLANGLLLYALVWRLSGTRVAALTAAALFLFHPLQVESVVWISQRKNVLALFFFLISLWCYLRYRSGNGEGKRTFLIVSLLAFIAAILSKSVAVILPVVLLLLDLVLPDETAASIKKSLVGKLPYVIIAALCALLALMSQSTENLGGVRGAHLGGSYLVTLQTMLPVFARYLALLSWPEGLSIIYSPEVKWQVDGEVILSGLLLLLILCEMGLLFRRNRLLFFWWGLFLVGFLPVSQIVPLVTLMNDRYCYFPLLGFAGACGTLAGNLFVGESMVVKRAVAGGGIVLFLILATVSRQRTAVWRDPVTLWTATLRGGVNAYAYDARFVDGALAESYLWRAQQKEEKGQGNSAAVDYLAAVTTAPDNYEALYGAGVYFSQNGKPLVGRRYFQRLTEKFPKSYEGWLSLGLNFMATKEYDRSATAVRAALALKPGDGRSRLLLGQIASASGRPDEARKEYLAAEAAGIHDPVLSYNLACIEARAGRLQDALARLEQALASGYGDIDAMRRDPDLAAVRSLPGFERLLARNKGRNPNIR